MKENLTSRDDDLGGSMKEILRFRLRLSVADLVTTREVAWINLAANGEDVTCSGGLGVGWWMPSLASDPRYAACVLELGQKHEEDLVCTGNLSTDTVTM